MMQSPMPQPPTQPEQSTPRPGEQPFVYYQPVPQPVTGSDGQPVLYPQPQPISGTASQPPAEPEQPISWRPLYLVFVGAVITGCLLWIQQVGQRRTEKALNRPQPTPTTIQSPTPPPTPSTLPQSASDPLKTPQPQPSPSSPPVSTPQISVSLPVITPNGITVCPDGSGTCGVRLRAAPSLGSAVYTTLPSDVPVQWIGPVQTDEQGIAWTSVNVDYNGQVYTGWIASNLLRRW